MVVPGFGWASKVHQKITSDAFFILPQGFRDYLGVSGNDNTELKALLKACLEPDNTLKDFRNHVYHIHGFEMGNGPFKIEQLVKEIGDDMHKKAPKAQILQKFGWLAHYAADIIQPLHTGVSTWEGIEEKAYHSSYETDADKNVYTFGVNYAGATMVRRISARQVYEALCSNQYYDAIQTAYTTGKKYEEVRRLTGDCYSRAVNNVITMWYTAWVLGGGKVNPRNDSKPRYFPPMQKESDTRRILSAPLRSDPPLRRLDD